MRQHNAPRRAAPIPVLLAALVAIATSACQDGEPAPTLEPTCRASLCAAAPLPVCDGDTRIVYQALGECTELGAGNYRCDYPIAQQQDCRALDGQRCEGGQCVPPPTVPCAGVVCNDPPAPACQDNVAVIYAATGTCDPTIGESGACVYPLETGMNCTDLGRMCVDGGCPDPGATPCDPNPCNVPPPAGCSGPAPQRYDNPGQCTRRGSGVTAYECAWTLLEFAECSGATPVCGGGRCATTTRAPAAPGELVIHEALINQAEAGDPGEWFELYNPTDAALDLHGCLLSDDGTNRYTFNTPVIVPALGYITLGRSGDYADTGGFEPDVVYSNYQLGNSRDSIELICDGVQIDRVAWDSETWPVRAGRAMSLRPGLANAVANDNPESWCLASTPYGNRRNMGSPRAANPPCED